MNTSLADPNAGGVTVNTVSLDGSQMQQEGNASRTTAEASSTELVR